MASYGQKFIATIVISLMLIYSFSITAEAQPVVTDEIEVLSASVGHATLQIISILFGVAIILLFYFTAKIDRDRRKFLEDFAIAKDRLYQAYTHTKGKEYDLEELRAKTIDVVFPRLLAITKERNLETIELQAEREQWNTGVSQVSERLAGISKRMFDAFDQLDNQRAKVTSIFEDSRAKVIRDGGVVLTLYGVGIVLCVLALWSGFLAAFLVPAGALASVSTPVLVEIWRSNRRMSDSIDKTTRGVYETISLQYEDAELDEQIFRYRSIARNTENKLMEYDEGQLAVAVTPYPNQRIEHSIKQSTQEIKLVRALLESIRSAPAIKYLVQESIQSAQESIQSAQESIQSAQELRHSAQPSIRSVQESIRSAQASIRSVQESIRSAEEIKQLIHVPLEPPVRKAAEQLLQTLADYEQTTNPQEAPTSAAKLAFRRQSQSEEPYSPTDQDYVDLRKRLEKMLGTTA